MCRTCKELMEQNQRLKLEVQALKRNEEYLIGQNQKAMERMVQAMRDVKRLEANHDQTMLMVWGEI